MTLYARPVLEISAVDPAPQIASTATLSLRVPLDTLTHILSASEWKGLVFEAAERWVGLPTRS